MLVKARCLDVFASLHFYNKLIIDDIPAVTLVLCQCSRAEPLGRARRPNQEKSRRCTSQSLDTRTKN